MIELQLEEFEKVRELFREVEYNLNCMVVIAGINPGRIWVDSKEKPTSGFLVDSIWSYFLAGNPNNKEFNATIAKILKEEILPIASKQEEKTHGDWVFYFEDQNWFEKIENEFVKYPIPLDRYYYVFDKLLIPDWRAEIPKGFEIRKIDESLLKQKNLENFEEIKNWIDSQYENEQKFSEKGFGFCLVENNKTIVCWCLSDWGVKKKIEIGIQTAADYRRRGFATLCVAATVEYGQGRGYHIGWHCNQDNEGSWRTAEKVGFVRKKSYLAANGIYNEEEHLLLNAWYRGLILDKPEDGIQYINKLLEMEPEIRHYFVYAQLLIKLKRLTEAIDALMKIVEMGHPDPTRFKEALETRELFQELRKLEEWKALMKKVEGMRET
ncbi:MAG: GNAT family N-acetyltransferase [Candidatus Heimdallarchaeota archaeon]|nr:GNAT family N-acetyltransferase [Candidatus Heimdallarchaeota archaeon]MCK4290734.1 GNAT family N-acetyltransferase [Candidatus Heimdallarchaeota archaeon]